MKFKDESHQKSYLEFIQKANMHPDDVERKSLFYLLAMFDETRNHISNLYDFKKNQIVLEGLNEAWQTSGTRACTKLAFNLYNSFTGFEDEETNRYSVIDIFACGSNQIKEIFLEAIKVRFELINDEATFFEPEETLDEKLKRMGFYKTN